MDYPPGTYVSITAWHCENDQREGYYCQVGSDAPLRSGIISGFSGSYADMRTLAKELLFYAYANNSTPQHHIYIATYGEAIPAEDLGLSSICRGKGAHLVYSRRPDGRVKQELTDHLCDGEIVASARIKAMSVQKNLPQTIIVE
jgi:hypothetical protein